MSVPDARLGMKTQGRQWSLSKLLASGGGGRRRAREQTGRRVVKVPKHQEGTEQTALQAGTEQQVGREDGSGRWPEKTSLDGGMFRAHDRKE